MQSVEVADQNRHKEAEVHVFLNTITLYCP